MKIFQIVDGKCYWCTPFSNLEEVSDRFPSNCTFIEAPDFVFEGWGFVTKDEEGNEITGDARFIKPEIPEGFTYDESTGEFIETNKIDFLLEMAKLDKQEENKVKFAEFLHNHPMLYTDGKYYGVTMEDQNEISLNLTNYQLQLQSGVENPVLEWHAVHEGCVAWEAEALTALTLAIGAFVYPWFRKMNEYKTQIFACTSKSEVAAINLVYKTEEELEAESIANNPSSDIEMDVPEE